MLAPLSALLRVLLTRAARLRMLLYPSLCCADATQRPATPTTLPLHCTTPKDNPLPVNYYKGSSKGTVGSLPFRAHFYYDGVGSPVPPPPPPPPPPPGPPVTCITTGVGVFDDSKDHQCGYNKLSDDSKFLKINSWQNAVRRAPCRPLHAGCDSL